MSSTAEAGGRVLPEDRDDLTWDEFLDLPGDDRYKRAELVDGKLVLMNPPVWMHQQIVGSLVALMWTRIRAGSGRGSVTMAPPVRITDRRGYEPDVAWFREENSRPGAGEQYLTAPPDLAVEVHSDSTRRLDQIRRRRDYAAVGVRELWLIEPEGDDDEPGPSAIVLRPPSTPTDPPEFVVVDDLDPSGVLTSPLLPGLEIRLAEPMRS